MSAKTATRTTGWIVATLDSKGRPVVHGYGFTYRSEAAARNAIERERAKGVPVSGFVVCALVVVPPPETAGEQSETRTPLKEDS